MTPSVRRRQVVAEVVVVLDEVGEGSLQHRGRLVDDELDLSFEGAVVALDLAVGLRVVEGGDDVADAEQVTDSLRWAVTVSRLWLDALLGRLGPQFSSPDL